ncbi:MAG: dihydroorotate dehydrogenase electron transfer subunit [Eubacteriales bacterium]|nr:dihydroorotate dehydrogenase electron transfer subunit [Eubacteriales bacterium]
MYLEKGKVRAREERGCGYYWLEIESPAVAAAAVPGQFVHVRVGEKESMDPLLRRPISLARIEREKGRIGLLYRVVGRGTKLLSSVCEGAELDLMGPLGRGFTLVEKGKRVAVIGGGIGAAPLFPLVAELVDRGAEVKFFLGAANHSHLQALQPEKMIRGGELVLATDDGSAGFAGRVTDLVRQEIGPFRPDFFYACGPVPMLRAVQQLMAELSVPGELSLEERMGCGVGACLACVCKVRTAEAPFTYRKVCSDGPVFPAGEVLLD